MKKEHFVIIGAGISGMTSALLLARHGHRVTLVEKFPKPAPTLRGFTRHGVSFDTGLHYLGSWGPGEILDTYFNYLGLTNLERAPYDAHGFDRMRFLNDAREFDLPFGYDRLQTCLSDRFPADTKAIATYLNAVRQDFNSSPFLNLERSFSREDMNPVASDISLAGYLKSLTTNPLLTSILSMHSLLYGVSPEDSSFSDHAKIAGSYYQSANGIRGGGISLVRSYEQALSEAGVDLVCGSGVQNILTTSSGTIRGIELENGRIMETSQVICTTHPRVLLDLVPENGFRPVYRRRLAALRDTPSAYMLFGISDSPIPSVERRNLFVCRETAVQPFFAENRRPEEGPFYIASAACPGREQTRGIVAIAPGHIKDAAPWAESRTGQRPAGYKAYKEERLTAMRESLCAACPEFSKVRFVDGATPLTLRDYMHIPTGGLYGPGHTMDQFNPVPATRIPGLLLAGQAVVAPGVLGAVISAVLTCGFIVGHETIRKELIACA